MIDRIRLLEANRQLRRELFDERQGSHWVGRLASSSLSTATAISALSIVQRQRRWEEASADPTDEPLKRIDRARSPLVVETTESGWWVGRHGLKPFEHFDNDVGARRFSIDRRTR